MPAKRCLTWPLYLLWSVRFFMRNLQSNKLKQKYVYPFTEFVSFRTFFHCTYYVHSQGRSPYHWFLYEQHMVKHSRWAVFPFQKALSLHLSKCLRGTWFLSWPVVFPLCFAGTATQLPALTSDCTYSLQPDRRQFSNRYITPFVKRRQ